MARLIQIFEHERLTLYKNERGEYLTTSELGKLYAFNDHHDNIYFTGIRDGVKFNSYVGVIQIGNLVIEILPKVDKKHKSDKKDYDKWRNVLLSMLAVCKKIKVDSISEASLNRRYHSILELYFEIYLDEISVLLHKGLIKKYHYISKNATALKGRIEFSKNIQKNTIHKERFYTTHQVYDYENIINQILLKGLSILSKLITNPYLKDRVARIKRDFPEIKEIDITKHHFDQLSESRKTVAYNEAIQVAQMIILNYSPDIKSGHENMLTLLFDMNKLWEEYVFRMLQKYDPVNYIIEFQNSQKFWEAKTIRPDIVITKKEGNQEEKYVIDAKWKIVDSQNPSDDDLKQMYAYNLYWNVEKSMLLFPRYHDYKEKYGKFHKGGLTNNCCKIGFVNVLNEEDTLNYNIGKAIIDKLSES